MAHKVKEKKEKKNSFSMKEGRKRKVYFCNKLIKCVGEGNFCNFLKK